MSDETDPHPDDPEFERLLALLLAEARVPGGETDEQHDDRMGRYHEIERQLHELYRPVKGVDYHPSPRTKPSLIWRSLTPGIFTSGDRGRVLRQDGATELVAHWAVEDLRHNPKQRFGPSLTAMSLVDHFTHARQPVPDYVVDLIARLAGKHAQIYHETAEAWRLTGEGLNVAQIAERLGPSERTVERRLAAHPAAVEPDVALLLEDARCRGSIEHWPPHSSRRLVAVLRAQADRPLPLEVYQAVALALGLAHQDGALTDAAVVALHGVKEPTAYHATALEEGEERYQQPRGTVAVVQRQGPQQVRPVNIVSSMNGLRKRAGVDRATVEKWVQGPAVPTTDWTFDPDWTFEEWMEHASSRIEEARRFVAGFKAASPWQREAWANELIANWAHRPKRRQNS